MTDPTGPDTESVAIADIIAAMEEAEREAFEES